MLDSFRAVATCSYMSVIDRAFVSIVMIRVTERTRTVDSIIRFTNPRFNYPGRFANPRGAHRE